MQCFVCGRVRVCGGVHEGVRKKKQNLVGFELEMHHRGDTEKNTELLSRTSCVCMCVFLLQLVNLTRRIFQRTLQDVSLPSFPPPHVPLRE